MLRIKEQHLAGGGKTLSREEIAAELRERRGGHLEKKAAGLAQVNRLFWNRIYLQKKCTGITV
jgi:hypothetical protein